MDWKLITWAHMFLQKGNGPILVLRLKKSVFLFSVVREWKLLKVSSITCKGHFMNILAGKSYRYWMVFMVSEVVSQFCLHIFSQVVQRKVSFANHLCSVDVRCGLDYILNHFVRLRFSLPVFVAHNNPTRHVFTMIIDRVHFKMSRKSLTNISMPLNAFIIENMWWQIYQPFH